MDFDHQVLAHFQGHYKQFSLRMEMQKQESKQILVVKLFNNQTSENYIISIDEEYIQSESKWTNIFDAPFGMFCSLVQNSRDIVIDANGEISFQYRSTGMKRQKIIVIIRTKKLNKNSLQEIENKLAAINQKLDQQISHRDKKMNEFAQELQALKQHKPARQGHYQAQTVNYNNSNQQLQERWSSFTTENQEIIKQVSERNSRDIQDLRSENKRIIQQIRLTIEKNYQSIASNCTNSISSVELKITNIFNEVQTLRSELQQKISSQRRNQEDIGVQQIRQQIQHLKRLHSQQKQQIRTQLTSNVDSISLLREQLNQHQKNKHFLLESIKSSVGKQITQEIALSQQNIKSTLKSHLQSSFPLNNPSRQSDEQIIALAKGFDSLSKQLKSLQIKQQYNEGAIHINELKKNYQSLSNEVKINNEEAKKNFQSLSNEVRINKDSLGAEAKKNVESLGKEIKAVKTKLEQSQQENKMEMSFFRKQLEQFSDKFQRFLQQDSKQIVKKYRQETRADINAIKRQIEAIKVSMHQVKEEAASMIVDLRTQNIELNKPIKDQLLSLMTITSKNRQFTEEANRKFQESRSEIHFLKEQIAALQISVRPESEEGRSVLAGFRQQMTEHAYSPDEHNTSKNLVSQKKAKQGRTNQILMDDLQDLKRRQGYEQKDMNSQENQEPLLKQNQTLGHNPLNPLAKNLNTFIKGCSLFVSKQTADSKWYSFINKYEILPGRTMTYTLKLNKLTDRYLFIGFGTKEVFGLQYVNHQQAFTYCCHNGNVFESCAKRQVGIKSSVGQVLVLTADLIQNKIICAKNGNAIIQSALTQQMINKSLYLLIGFGFKGDEVQVIPN